MIGEFPGLADARRRTATSATRATSAHVYTHARAGWLGVDAAGIIPDAARFTTPLPLFK